MFNIFKYDGQIIIQSIQEDMGFVMLSCLLMEDNTFLTKFPEILSMDFIYYLLHE
jgi:hypothetical protein